MNTRDSKEQSGRITIQIISFLSIFMSYANGSGSVVIVNPDRSDPGRRSNDGETFDG
jgi:hypothetical protein